MHFIISWYWKLEAFHYTDEADMKGEQEGTKQNSEQIFKQRSRYLLSINIESGDENIKSEYISKN